VAQFDYVMSMRDAVPQGYELALGRYFTVRFPDDWPEEQRYDFTSEWSADMRHEEDPFQNFSYC
jgi:hypothetical protein